MFSDRWRLSLPWIFPPLCFQLPNGFGFSFSHIAACFGPASDLRRGYPATCLPKVGPSRPTPLKSIHLAYHIGCLLSSKNPRPRFPVRWLPSTLPLGNSSADQGRSTKDKGRRAKDEGQSASDHLPLITVHCFYGGKFMRRRRSWKRGSERRGSHLGSTLIETRSPSRS